MLAFHVVLGLFRQFMIFIRVSLGFRLGLGSLLNQAVGLVYGIRPWDDQEGLVVGPPASRNRLQQGSNH